jgi:hypothetical protein
MSTLLITDTALSTDEPLWSPDETQLAAGAFLARYSGRTLDDYRHDLRSYFQWAADRHLNVLEVTRVHIELYRSTMEQRGLAASTIDRRLSTVCGYYRSPTSMVASPPTRRSTCDDRRSNPSYNTPWTAASGPYIPTCCALRSSWPRSARASRCATSSPLPATPIPAPPRSTTGDARTSIAAAYVVVAFVTSG